MQGKERRKMDPGKMVPEAGEMQRPEDALLIQQIRLAAMGEVIGNIANQWRQPLNSVGIIIQDVQECYDFGELTPDYLKSRVRQAMELISRMSRTIDDFGNLVCRERAAVSFNAGDAVRHAVKFLSGSFETRGIRLDLVIERDVAVTGSPNEYSQAVLNILGNARDALLERRVADPLIMVHVSEREGRSLVTISDNAGGIPAEIAGRIFDPYFCGNESGGVGLGLYISKMIIERIMKGRLRFRNGDGGAVFTIEV